MGSRLTQVLGFSSRCIADRCLALRTGCVEGSCCGCFRHTQKKSAISARWVDFTCDDHFHSLPSSGSRSDRGPAGICCAVAMVKKQQQKRDSQTSFPRKENQRVKKGRKGGPGLKKRRSKMGWKAGSFFGPRDVVGCDGRSASEEPLHHRVQVNRAMNQ